MSYFVFISTMIPPINVLQETSVFESITYFMEGERTSGKIFPQFTFYHVNKPLFLQHILIMPYGETLVGVNKSKNFNKMI